MKDETCYKCDLKATGREHVPPLCLFPETKDLNENFRKNLITVPSCDIHNLKKSNDDEFLMMCLAGIVGNNQIGYLQNRTKVRRALDRKYLGFIDRVIKDAKDLNIKTEEGFVFPVLSGKPDMVRLIRCMDFIASGIYYIEFGKKFIGKTKTLFGFIKYQDSNINTLVNFLHDKFETESDLYACKGENPKVFKYQIQPPDNYGLIAIKFTFYEGTHIYTAIMDENSKEPLDLQMKLINSGVKSIIEYNGKNYDFN